MEHDGCVKCKYESEPETSAHCVGCKQNAIDKYTPMTNADKVRNMNDEELEAFIQSPCSFIRPDRKGCKFLCDECIGEWLKEKVE